MSGHGKKATDQGVLTLWRRQRQGLVRIQKGIDRGKDTHFLETREGLVRTWKEIDRARVTHSLKTAEGGRCQDTERTQRSERHPLPGDGGRWDLSGHGKEPAERGALTSWR